MSIWILSNLIIKNSIWIFRTVAQFLIKIVLLCNARARNRGTFCWSEKFADERSRAHGEENRFWESRTGQGLLAYIIEKYSPRKSSFPFVCVLAFKIAFLKYENYCLWLCSVSFTTSVYFCFSYFLSFLSFCCKIHAAIGIALKRSYRCGMKEGGGEGKREREGGGIVCFDFLFHRRENICPCANL